MPIVVDGDNAQVLVRPAEDILQTVYAAIDARAERRRKYAALRDLPSATRDQARISLHMNAGLLIDMQHLDETGADGIGLYRTEIPFMVRSEFPDVDAQAWLYSRVLDLADGRPVTFRTLDVGGDKVLPYVGAFGDDNPAMGWRAIRIGLDRPAMLRRQLRALIQAANGRPLSVMFPMIAEVSELLRRAPTARPRTGAGQAAPRPGRARAAACWRYVRGAGAGLAARQPAAPRRLHFGGHQRSCAVPLCRRPRQQPFGRAATTACPQLCFDCYILWSRRCGRPASTSRCAARWRAARSRRWPCWRSACARLSMSPGAIGPVKAMIRSLDLNEATGFMTLRCHNRIAPCARRCACSLLITRSKFNGKKSNRFCPVMRALLKIPKRGQAGFIMPDQVDWRALEREASPGRAVGRLLRDQREARGLSVSDIEKSACASAVTYTRSDQKAPSIWFGLRFFLSVYARSRSALSRL